MKKILIAIAALTSLFSSYAYAIFVVQGVPTMSEWALILLIVLVVTVGLTRFKRKA